MKTTNKFLFEDSLSLTPVAGRPDTFVNTNKPWQIPGRDLVLGAITLAQGTLAAWQTVPDGLSVHCLHSQFLAPASLKHKLMYEVQRLRTTKGFASRTVSISQNEQVCMILFLSFTTVNISPNSGPVMQHVVPVPQADLADQQREIDSELDEWIARDPFNGPFISAERLPVVNQTAEVAEQIVRAKLRITTSLSSAIAQVLAIVHISDLYILDAPLTLNHLGWGPAAVGDRTQRPRRSDCKLLTTLNHTIHFYRAEGFDAQDGVFLEVTSPWAHHGRALAHSTIRDRDGEVIATCVQEGFYILKKDAKPRHGSTLPSKL